jgi:hypothetical protein
MWRGAEGGRSPTGVCVWHDFQRGGESPLGTPTEGTPHQRQGRRCEAVSGGSRTVQCGIERKRSAEEAGIQW